MKTFPMGGSTSNWLTYLKSSHQVLVASLDGRGSASAGDKLKFEMYRKLSVVEIADQITGGEYFKSLDAVDTSLPAAIFGWSYGGGVAAHVIGDTSTTFKCGISVAPVTTKAYYDTAYTERYLAMATPDDDEAGYNATDVMNKVANFANKTYLIAHGTADDNVHYMHAAHLIRALSDAQIQFRQLTYMDQNHGINSYGQSQHLYASMTNFLLDDCWQTSAQSLSGAAGSSLGVGRQSTTFGLVAALLASFFRRH
jgi:dipeptidyl-peptidase-4